MFSGNKNLIKSILLVILASSLPINITKANIFDRFIGNKFIGKWCISRVITMMGETKIPINDIDKNCFTFKRGGELIVITESASGKSSYEVLDDENIAIIPLNGAKQSSMKYDADTGELKIISNWSGDIFGYTETYLKKQ